MACSSKSSALANSWHNASMASARTPAPRSVTDGSVVLSTAKAFCTSVFASTCAKGRKSNSLTASRVAAPAWMLPAASERPTPGRRSRCVFSVDNSRFRFLWLKNASSAIFVALTRADPSASALAFRSLWGSWYWDRIRPKCSVTALCPQVSSSGWPGYLLFPFFPPFLPLPFPMAGPVQSSDQFHPALLPQLMSVAFPREVREVAVAHCVSRAKASPQTKTRAKKSSTCNTAPRKNMQSNITVPATQKIQHRPSTT